MEFQIDNPSPKKTYETPKETIIKFLFCTFATSSNEFEVEASDIFK